MITAALVSGLAGFWVWTVLNDEDGIFKPITLVLHRTEITRKWLACPWCSGAWFSIAASLLLFHVWVTPAIITAIAAAAVCGVLGSYFQGD